ncbi:MAG: SigE family RNA polymerase sigma factor [Angustibacter sp.]
MRSAPDFDDFYASCGPMLVGQLYLLTGNREEARDCVQEAMGKAWLRWNEVSALEEPMAWVRLVARRLAVSRWRKTRNSVSAMIRSQSDELSDDESGHVVLRDELVQALQTLPVKQRTAVVLHYLCDLDLASVAEETNSSVGAVKSQLFRGRQALAEQLAATSTKNTTGESTATEYGFQSEVTW